MANATAAPGTIPAMPYYQSGALTFSGDERVELSSSGQATSAVTAQVKITDLVGKAPLNMTGAVPTSGDLVAFFQVATNLPVATQFGNIGVTFGNLPTGGNPGQILNKLAATNYSANWSSIVSFVSADGATLSTSGNATSIVLAVATAGIGSTQIATNAVGNAQFRQSAGISVVGNAGSALANVADITATGGFQVLQVNAGGTGLVFATLGTSSLTGVVPVTLGGTNTSVLGTHAVMLGAGTATVQFASPSSGGNLLIDQGASSNPAFTPVTGDVTISSAGTTTIGANKVTYAKFQQGTALSVLGVAGNAVANFAAITGAANQVLQVNPGGTGVLFGSLNLASAFFTGVLPVVNGGIGTAAVSAASLLLGGANATAPLTNVANATANYALVGTGTTTAPTFTAVLAGIDFVMYQGGNVLSTGIYGNLSVPFNCQIQNIAVLGNTSGTATIDVFKATFASWPTATSITAGAGWSILGTSKFSTTSFSGTTTFNASDIMQFIATSTISTVTEITVALQVVKI
jgi:hypothetical protein